MRDALVRIDEQVLGLCFIDDAEKVVAHDRAYLKDFPYLEFVKPLWDEFDAMFLEWLGLKSSLYGKGDHDDDKSRRIGKKAYVRGKYGPKSANLLARLSETKKRVAGRPQTIESLERLETAIRDFRASWTEK